MSEERKQILRMLSEGKIDIAEAERLLDAVDDAPEKSATPQPSTGKTNAKYLRVLVEPKSGGRGERVNIRVPLQLIRAGAKIASFLPDGAKFNIEKSLKDKGVNFGLSDINRENVDEILNALREMSIDVDSDEEMVKIFCE
jgi:hypothetical protein